MCLGMGAGRTEAFVSNTKEVLSVENDKQHGLGSKSMEAKQSHVKT
jgi:hypothetical protein